MKSFDISLTENEHALLLATLRRHIIKLYGEAKAAEELNAGDDMDTVIVGMYQRKAYEAQTIFLWIKSQLVEFLLSRDDLDTVLSTFREAKIHTLGEAALYNTLPPDRKYPDFNAIMAKRHLQEFDHLDALHKKIESYGSSE